MRESLPNSVMMIWQGVGHCLGEGGDYPGSGMKPCLDRLPSQSLAVSRLRGVVVGGW